MANMKTLTVNGVSYTVDDPDAVSYGEEQALTEEQKQQARENIGAVSRTEVDNAVAELTQKDLDMNGHGIVGVEYYGVEKDHKGFWLESGGYIDIEGDRETGTRRQIALFTGMGTNTGMQHSPVILRGVYPGQEDMDAVNKAQLESAVDAAMKAVVDKLCPAINESGAVVTCQPVEGYPLTVVTADGATQVTRCGKNLIGFSDFEGVTASVRTYSCKDGVITCSFSATISTNILLNATGREYMEGSLLVPGTYVFSVAYPNGGLQYEGAYAKVELADGTTVNLPDGVAVTLTQPGTIKGFEGTSKIFQAGDKLEYTLQIECGKTATAFEPYCGGSFVPGDTVPALPGVNTVFADVGEVTVTGRADPAAILEKLL